MSNVSNILSRINQAKSSNTTGQDLVTDFGDEGIACDVIAESTAGTGVTVDGVLCLDGGMLAAGATNGLGYTTGAGGAKTQITSAATTVALNSLSGLITTFALTTAAAAEEKFTVLNSKMTTTDVVAVSTSYNGDGSPIVFVTGISGSGFIINITNVHATEALNAVMGITFAIIRGAGS